MRPIGNTAANTHKFLIFLIKSKLVHFTPIALILLFEFIPIDYANSAAAGATAGAMLMPIVKAAQTTEAKIAAKRWLYESVMIDSFNCKLVIGLNMFNKLT